MKNIQNRVLFLLKRSEYDYDHAGRLLKTKHQIGNQSEILMSELAYDNLGRLTSKKLHDNTEIINYTYNIRNWLKSINSPRFQETLYYQDGTTALYNGNISQMDWKVLQESHSHRYTFSYDGLNRLTDAVYDRGFGVSYVNTNYFNESMSYDKHGNILSLNRYMQVTNMSQLVNNMGYNYSGNQVTSINDYSYIGAPLNNGLQIFQKAHSYRPEEYIYDANGRMTVDYNKGIAKIQYNSLNLPKKMQFLPGHILEYGYDALGGKRTEISTAAVTGINVPMGTIKPLYSWEVLYSSQRDYCGNVVYGGNGTHVLQLQTPEGYARRDYVGSGDWVYFYTLKDHLGSVRSEFSTSSNWTPGFTHYYPVAFYVKSACFLP